MAGLGIAGARYAEAPDAADGALPAAEPAVPVTVKTTAMQKIRLWSEFSGRLHAVDVAEIRPEVGGRITEVLFEDGQSVEAGDILFVIDPRPYEAAVARAEAELASAQADAAFTRIDLERAAALVEKKAVSRRFHDERSNASRVAEAAVATAEAELERARLDLAYAYVRAPISGRAGRVEITVGNLVQPGPTAPLLTTVVGNGAIYADFEVDEQTYLESIRNHATGRAEERRIPVQLTLPNGGGRVHQGYIYSFDNRIDATSGTIRARARFANPDGALLPGMFVSIRLAEAVEREVVLVPERAVGTDLSRKFVYVVDAAGRVDYRQVRLGREVQSSRVVLEGVQPGDRVIVDGIQHVRPDTLVAAQEIAPEASSQTAQSSTAPATLQTSLRD